jgi:hypothetical protein
MDIGTETNKERRSELVQEYVLTQQMAIHYDQMNWQIGSILIAGIFISIGIIGNKIDAYLWLGIISFVILYAWNRFYFRHKAIQNKKFERLHEIESELGFCQHLKIKEGDQQGSLKGIHGGDITNYITYIFPALLLIIYFIHKYHN